MGNVRNAYQILVRGFLGVIGTDGRIILQWLM